MHHLGLILVDDEPAAAEAMAVMPAAAEIAVLLGHGAVRKQRPVAGKERPAPRLREERSRKDAPRQGLGGGRERQRKRRDRGREVASHDGQSLYTRRRREVSQIDNSASIVNYG
jgi:hypothetical protein